jgi:hypothetical protein
VAELKDEKLEIYLYLGSRNGFGPIKIKLGSS